MKEGEKKDIVWIPLDKIVPSRERSGIRNKEKYERLKENIKEHGLNISLCVFPVHDDKYEVFAGDHRLMILKELGWKKAPCIIEKMSELRALELCVSDNTCRADLGSVELENKITKLYKLGNYKSKAECGKRTGKTGQRIGQLLKSKKDRAELNKISKVPFTVSTEVILASRPLTSKNDRAALLELVQKKKIHAKDTEKVAKLCQSDKILNRMILHEGIPYNQVIAEFQNKIDKETKKKKTKTMAIDNPQLSKDIYKTVSENIDTYLLTLDDGNSKKTAVNYLKMTVAVIAETLCHDGVITKEQFKQIKDDILKVYMDSLKDYKGESLSNNIGKWEKGHSVKKF